MMKKLLTIGLAIAGLAIIPGAASASSWHSCSAPVRSYSGYEIDARWSGLEAKGKMNCASARYAYAVAFGVAKRSGIQRAAVINDGYVTWYRSAWKLSGPANGCGNYVSLVTYREYKTNTAFRFRAYESGC
jgi:hypothetical protein